MARDSSYLLSGQVGGAVLRLINLGIAARVLGPHDYGSVALVMAYAGTIDRLCNFQSWQPIIRYGADLLDVEQRRRLARLLTLGFSVDLLTALAASGIGFALSFLVFPLFDWDPIFSTLGRAYLLTLPFHATGAMKGALRLFGRFDLIGKQSLWGPAVALVLLVVVGLAYELSPLSVVLIYALADIAASGVYLVYGGSVLRARQLEPSWSARNWRELARDFPGFTRFLVSSNLNGTSKLAITDLDTLLSGIVLGPSGAAFYRITKSIAKVITMGSGAVYETLYPEFAKLVARRQSSEMLRVGRRIGLWLAGASMLVVALFALVGQPVIEHTVGPEYAPIYGAFLIYGVGLALQMLSVPLSAQLLALNLPTAAMRWYWLAAILFLVAFYGLGSSTGLLGACAAFSLYWVVFLSGSRALVRGRLRETELPVGEQ